MSCGSRSRRPTYLQIISLLLLIALPPARVPAAAAQGVDSPDMVTRKVRFRGGEDPNVKAAPEVNTRNKPSNVVPPAGKAAVGRVLCAVTFDNHTDLITKI